MQEGKGGKNIMLRKFTIFPLAACAVFCIPYAEVNAVRIKLDPNQVPLWSYIICEWALSQCREDEIPGSGHEKTRCENFNKELNPYFCAGSSSTTGLDACKAALNDPKSDACADGYRKCNSNAFGP